MTDIYSIRDVARIFGMKESRLRYWAQTGFVNPSVRKHGRRYYTFGDLIQVRAAKELLDAGLSMQRVRGNLEALRALVPDIAYPASKMHICSDGETIVARHSDVLFEPLSRQVVMDFTVDSLSTQVADILALPTTPAGPEIPAPAVEARAKPRVVPEVLPQTPPIAPDPAPGGDGETLAPPAARAANENVPGEGIASPVDDEPTATHIPVSSYRYFLAGCDAEDRGDIEAAERAYRQALEWQPTLAAAHTNLGNLKYRGGDAVGARASYERALECEPNQPEARYNLGNVLEDMGETELAIAELKRVCWIHPDFADAHYNLGLMLARVGGIVQAQEHLNRYLQYESSGEWADRARNFLAALG